MKNGLKLTFAGQAGFIIDTADGYRIGIDLYLSDCCNRYFGFKRLMPYIFDPMTLGLDLLIATHAHYDHFDPDAVPLIMSDARTELLCAYDVKGEAERLGLDEKRITYAKVGDTFERDGVKIKAVACDHGSETPHAIGLLIFADGKKIYIAGDTCYREDNLSSEELHGADIMIMPINGAFGNLNEREGARAVSVVEPALAIPCHYWNFAEHGGNPDVFAHEMKEVYGNDRYLLMRAGEQITL